MSPALPLALLFTTAVTEPDYPRHADSVRQEGVPQGTVTKHEWKSTEVYPGTLREYYVYVPHGAPKDAALMVFQDGHSYVSENGDFRVPVVFDNLIHQGKMPPTVAVLINPGWYIDSFEEPQGWKQPEGVRSNRANEYDTPDGTFAGFLENEILPEVGKSVSFTSDPERRAIGGSSSGGICAFTAAWHRPDLFRKVYSSIGSFVNIRGGYAYPYEIRHSKGDPKPLRVYLQDGENDLDNRHGNWPLANKQMAAALKFAEYDFRFDLGPGAHNGKHAGSIFPDALAWLWRES
jgi:enterochelin esterase family protein